MKRIPVILMPVLLLLLGSCSKRTHPVASEQEHTEKVVVVKKIKTPVPQVITVNDKYARKSVDGRYYYDLEGHRYWRNNKDGRYYLFNKSMFSDDAFKAPAKE